MKISKLIVVLISFVGALIIAILAPFYTWLSVALISSLVFSFVSFCCLFFIKKEVKFKMSALNILYFYVLSAFILEVLFYLLYISGILEHFRDIESAKNFILSFGALAWIVFFVVQYLQVVILPIPAQITIIAGVFIFGAFQTFLITTLAVVLGSLTCFFIGRGLQKKVLYKIFEKQKVDKYLKLMSSKGKILLPAFFLLPVFPDDLLCFVAGATTMSFKYFFWVSVIVRPITIACVCYLGSGKLIPFNSWGIPVWCVLGLIVLACIVLLLKYQEEIEQWMINRVKTTKK